jgi:hypothetical protein
LYVFLGGLDPKYDGQFHYVWQDDAMQVVYHAATLMPSTESDTEEAHWERLCGDGQFHYVWQDDAMQVVYHAATLMPSTESDTEEAHWERLCGEKNGAFVLISNNEDKQMVTNFKSYKCF